MLIKLISKELSLKTNSVKTVSLCLLPKQNFSLLGFLFCISASAITRHAAAIVVTDTSKPSFSLNQNCLMFFLNSLEVSNIMQYVVASGMLHVAGWCHREIATWQGLADYSWLTTHFIWSVLLCSRAWGYQSNTKATLKTLFYVFQSAAALTQ